MQDFKEYLNEAANPAKDAEVLRLYLRHKDLKVAEIAANTSHSVAEVYRILHRYTQPNRQKTNHHHVLRFAEFGFPVNQISELTGYSSRNVRYILSKPKDVI